MLGDWTGGRLPAVAATVAFGMGIDRGGVALVAHYNLPKTLEGFYQVGGCCHYAREPSQNPEQHRPGRGGARCALRPARNRGLLLPGGRRSLGCSNMMCVPRRTAAAYPASISQLWLFSAAAIA